LSAAKSEIIKKLNKNYPNFFKKDITKLINIFLVEVKRSLKRKNRVELRDIFTMDTRHQKARYARNPKTNEKIFIKDKYNISFKPSKLWLKKINEEISMLIEKSKIESEKLIKNCHESNMNNLNTELQKVIKQLDQKEKELFLDIQMKEQEIKKNIYKYSKDLAEQIYRKILNRDKAIKITNFKLME